MVAGVIRRVSRIHVGESRLRTRQQDGLHRRNERVRRHDDFVTQPDTEGPERQVKRIGAVCDAYRVLAPAKGCELVLEPGDSVAADERARVEQFRPPGQDFVRNLLSHGSEVEKRHRARFFETGRAHDSFR